jgi:hypothetical protein
MRPLLSIGLAAFCIGVGTGASTAQSLAKPGQIVPASNAILQPAAGFSSIAATRVDIQEQRHDRIVNRVWVGSMLAMVAATAMDAGTSVGKYEGNSLLASSNGTFGAKGISIKAGVAAGTIITEVLLRKHKDLRTKFAIGNFGETAFFAAVAVHNMGIASPK